MSEITAEELRALEELEKAAGAEPFSNLDNGEYLGEVVEGVTSETETTGLKLRLKLKVLSPKSQGRTISDFLGWDATPSTQPDKVQEQTKMVRGQFTRAIRVGIMQKNGFATRDLLDAYKLLPATPNHPGTEVAFNAIGAAVTGAKVYFRVEDTKPSKTTGKTYKRITYIGQTDVKDLSILPATVSL